MPTSAQQEVVDLCSDDEYAKMPPFVSRKSSRTAGLEFPFDNPYAGKKKKVETLEEKTFAVTTNHNGSSIVGMSLDNDSSAAALQSISVSSPLIFLNSEGTDDGIVTTGLAALIRDFPNTISCVARREQSTLHHIQQLNCWSCGIRNLQMLLSAVLPLLPSNHSYYQQQTCTVNEGYICIPSLLQVQQTLENSWSAGFDEQGAEHYQHGIVGTQAQIGAVEVSTCLAFLGIENAVIQFITCHESRSLLAPFCAAYFSKQSGACPYCQDSKSSHAAAQQLLRIAENSNVSSLSSPSCPCPSFPLYLQWKGHSVSVIGVECGSDGGKVKNLLVFDPLQKGSKLKESLLKRDLKPLRLSVSKLEKRDCQIVVVSTKTLTLEEATRLKSGVNALTAAFEAVTSHMRI